MTKDYQEVGAVPINDVIVLDIGQIWKGAVVLLIICSEDTRVGETDSLEDLFVQRTTGSSEADGDVVDGRTEPPVMTGGEGDPTATVPGPDHPPAALQEVQ